jgi:hypothetical protein
MSKKTVSHRAHRRAQRGFKDVSVFPVTSVANYLHTFENRYNSALDNFSLRKYSATPSSYNSENKK